MPIAGLTGLFERHKGGGQSIIIIWESPPDEDQLRAAMHEYTGWYLKPKESFSIICGNTLVMLDQFEYFIKPIKLNEVIS